MSEKCNCGKNGCCSHDDNQNNMNSKVNQSGNRVHQTTKKTNVNNNFY